MTNLRLNGSEYDTDAVIAIIDDEVRDRLHLIGYDNDQRFLDAYAVAHAEKFDGERFTI